MIVDVHAHAWSDRLHFDADFRRQAKRARGGQPLDLTTRYRAYRDTAVEEMRTIVFGGKARRSGLWVDDDFVASYVQQDPRRLIGFMSIDPTEPDWYREMREGHEQLGLCGIKLMPMYAGFQPDDRRIDPLYRYAQRHSLPILLHTGTTFISQAPLAYTLPRHLDTVAIRFPQLRLVLAHLGHPYEGECLAVIRKHPHVYADISALHYRPFQLYQSLMLVQEYGVWNKILFGTDFPFTTVNDSIAGLNSLNDMTIGTHLPRLDTSAIDRMIHRDTLRCLGLACD